MNRDVFRALRLAVMVIVIAFIYWPLAAIYIVTGIYDVVRQNYNDKIDLARRYFLGNGTLAWAFSPFNLLVDIISLPYINKQIYKLEDLPAKHQEEIGYIMANCPNEYLTSSVEKAGLESGRSMLLYKWYGFNLSNKYECAIFHEKYKTIQTIGVSTFHKQTRTSRHFGWLRAGVRVLINIDNEIDDGAYIEVNNQIHSWKDDGPLFIFDDTVLHQSFNLTDHRRHCLFIDVTRPSYLSGLLTGFIRLLGVFSVNSGVMGIASNWKIKR